MCIVVNHGFLLYFFLFIVKSKRASDYVFVCVCVVYAALSWVFFSSVFTGCAVHNSCFSLQSLWQINRATEECDWAAVVIYVSSLALRFSFAPVELPQSALSPSQGRRGSNSNGRWCSLYLIWTAGWTAFLSETIKLEYQREIDIRWSWLLMQTSWHAPSSGKLLSNTAADGMIRKTLQMFCIKSSRWERDNRNMTEV